MKYTKYLLVLSVFVLLFTGCSQQESTGEHVDKEVKLKEKEITGDDMQAKSDKEEESTEQAEMSDEEYIEESNIASYIPEGRETTYIVAHLQESPKKEVVAIYKNDQTGFDEEMIVLSFEEDLEAWAKIYEEEIMSGMWEHKGSILKDENKELESLVFEYRLSGTGHYSSAIVLDVIDQQAQTTSLSSSSISSGVISVMDNHIVFSDDNTREYFTWENNKFTSRVNKVTKEEVGAKVELIYSVTRDAIDGEQVDLKHEPGETFTVQKGDKILIGTQGTDQITLDYMADNDVFEYDQESGLSIVHVIGEPGETGEIEFYKNIDTPFSYNFIIE